MKLIISAKIKQKNGAYIEGDIITIDNQSADRPELKIDCTSRKLRGSHNLENIAAAALATDFLGVDSEIIAKTCNSFTGLEHRLQFIGTFNNISFYNDSISTVPETTLAAVNAFSEPIHLLLGGSEKGLSYDNLVNELSEKKNIASITLLGEVGKKLEVPIKESLNTELFGPFTNFTDAVDNVKTIAKPGDVVLLSPASASFDMFKNYADRGRQFVKLVTNNNG